MKSALLLFLFAFSIAYPLIYSTLVLSSVDQNGNPIPKADFFLTCKMTMNSPERFLCTSGASGVCKSACIECSNGTAATVRAAYQNQSLSQEIPSWKGISENCAFSSEPSNSVQPFRFNITAPVSIEEDGDENASGNIPENVTIESKDYHLGGEDYSDYNASPDVATGVKTSGGSCLPAFALSALAAAFALCRSRP